MKNKIALTFLSLLSFNTFAVENTNVAYQPPSNFPFYFITCCVLAVIGYYVYQYFQKYKPTETEESRFSDSQEMDRLLAVRDLRMQIQEIERLSKVGNAEIFSDFISQANNELKYLQSGNSSWKQRSVQRNTLTEKFNILTHKETI